MGRPTKYDETRRNTVLNALRMGLSYETAAKLAGVSKMTLWTWRQEHEDFATECEQVVGQCEERLVQIIDTAAYEDHKAAQWLLERRFPRSWGNLRPEVLAARAGLEPPEPDQTEGQSDEELTEDVRRVRKT